MALKKSELYSSPWQFCGGLRGGAFDDFSEDWRRQRSRWVEVTMGKPVVQFAETGEFEDEPERWRKAHE